MTGETLTGEAQIDRMIRGAPSFSAPPRISKPHGAISEGVEHLDLWPAPLPLPEGLPPVQEFKPSLLPAALQGGIMDIAERLQCPADYPAAATIVALGSVIGRQCGIRPKRLDDWLVVPNLMGAVIGRPGVMKTPAIEEPLRALRGLEAKAAENHTDAMKDWEAGQIVAQAAEKLTAGKVQDLMKKGDTAGARATALQHVNEEAEPPKRRRYVVNDATVEKLGEILRDNPNGILIWRDELTGLLRNVEKEGQEGAKAFLLEAWNGTGRFTYDRIGRGTIEVESCCLSVFGGIQPGPLSAYMAGMIHGGGGDDGLIQRLQITVWPNVSREWRNIDREPFQDARRAMTDTFNRLAFLDAATNGAAVDEEGAIPYLRFDAEAQEMFDEWRAELEAKVRSGNEHPALEAHLSKYRSLIPSLALILHLADSRTGPVPADKMIMAAAWGEYLEGHARRLYSTAISPAMASARGLATKLKAGEITSPFAPRDIYRHGWAALTSPDEVRGATDVLCDYEWVRAETIRTSTKPKTVFHINPNLTKRAAA